MTEKILTRGFLESVHENGSGVALSAPSGQLTYAELNATARAIAMTLSTLERSPADLVPILVERDLSAFAGILGILLSGCGYVPISSSFPPGRIETIVTDVESPLLLVDVESLDLAVETIKVCPSITTLFVLNASDDTELPDLPGVEVVSAFHEISDWSPVEVTPDSLAYVFYTSGSTGKPKGVKITHGNSAHYIDYMSARYQLSRDDRMLQITELTFDLSVFEQFMAWQAGCALYVPAHSDKLMISRFFIGNKITASLLTPSQALLMRKLRQLQPDTLPDMRLSLFCGEALPCEIADAWAQAAPNSVVENIYGPTELVISCLIHRWDKTLSMEKAINDIVPIGAPHDDIVALVIDEKCNVLPQGELGELVISGPMTPALGYWKNEAKTREVLIDLPGYDAPFYRTGDIAVQDVETGIFNWVARLDQQIKYHGHRIELGDIEAAIRRCIDCQQAVVVPWPIEDGQIMGLTVFVESENVIPDQEFFDRLSREVPDYMVPKSVIFQDRFPLNTSGKVDRPKLKAQLADT
jgi:amino acid adenylation domain-containing protein